MKSNFDRIYRIILMLFLSFSISGCFSTSYEYRTQESSHLSFQPRGGRSPNYSELKLDDVLLSSDARSLRFKINMLADGEEVETVTTMRESRSVRPPELIGDMSLFFLAVFPLLECFREDFHCFTYKYGDWYSSGEVGRKSTLTGKTEPREMELVGNYDGILEITGYDSGMKKLGTYRTNHPFIGNNSVLIENLDNYMAKRPTSLKVVGQFNTSKGKETIEMTVDPLMASKIKYGPYAWLSAADIKKTRLQEEVQDRRRQEEAQREQVAKQERIRRQQEAEFVAGRESEIAGMEAELKGAKMGTAITQMYAMGQQNLEDSVSKRANKASMVAAFSGDRVTATRKSYEAQQATKNSSEWRSAGTDTLIKGTDHQLALDANIDFERSALETHKRISSGAGNDATDCMVPKMEEDPATGLKIYKLDDDTYKELRNRCNFPVRVLTCSDYPRNLTSRFDNRTEVCQEKGIHILPPDRYVHDKRFLKACYKGDAFWDGNYYKCPEPR